MAHVDSPELFGDTVASVSLLSDCLLRFKERKQSNNKKTAETEIIDEYPVRLCRRSLIVLQDEARYNYPHEISKEQQEHFNGTIIERGKRISITLRHLKGQQGMER